MSLSGSKVLFAITRQLSLAELSDSNQILCEASGISSSAFVFMICLIVSAMYVIVITDVLVPCRSSTRVNVV